MKLLTALVTMTVTAVRAVPMNDYCMGCLTSMEAMFLLSRESKIANRDLPPITDIAAMLCFSEYFDLFNDFIKEGCQHMLKSNPDRFKRAIEQAVEIEVDSAAHAAKLVYFDFAKEVSHLLQLIIPKHNSLLLLQQCENQFNACDKNTFKRFPKQSDRYRSSNYSILS